MIRRCSPPDLIFLLVRRYYRRNVRYLLDHHDICSELFRAKLGKRWPRYQAMLFLEHQTSGAADVSLTTNESFRNIAIQRST